MAKKTIYHLIFLWSGSIIGRGSTFIIYIILAREIGPTLFGIFSSAMATTMIFTLLAGFGIPQVWLKIFGTEGWSAIRWVKPSLKFVALTLSAILLLIFFIGVVQPKDRITNILLLQLFLFLCGYVGVQLVSAKFQLEERYTSLTIWQFLPNVARLAILVFLFYIIRTNLSVHEIGLIYAFVGIGLTFIAIWQLSQMAKGKIDLKGHIVPKNLKKTIQISQQGYTVKNIARQSWPFGFAGIFAFVYIQSDIIMVRYISGDTEAGFYNVAFTLFSAVLTIPIILFSKFLIPKYHRWANQDKNMLFKTFKKGNSVMWATGILMAFILFVISPFFIPLFFGNDYMPAVNLMRILTFCIPLTFVSYSYGATLLTDQHVKLKVKLMGSVAFFNILLNVFLIPSYGPEGAAISTLLSNFFLMMLYRHYTAKKVFPNISS